MSHKIPEQEANAIRGLFSSMSTIKTYQRGFNDGVNSVSKVLETQLINNTTEAAEKLGVDVADFNLDPINGQLIARQITHSQEAPARGAVIESAGQPAPVQENAFAENARRSKELQEKRAKAEKSRLQAERKKSKEMLAELDGKIESFSPPMAQPLNTPEVPFASQLQAAVKIDNQVDNQISEVLKGLKERNHD